MKLSHFVTSYRNLCTC